MLLEQQSSSASPASTLVRGNSEPPEGGGGVNFNEINGLRRSRNPIKVAGITMGSQENVNDELAAVFATRRRRRRSATPVKIGGIVMGDGEEIEESQNSLPFGGNKRNSYHPGSSVTKRNTNLGMWGQRIFTNGHQNHENEAEKEDVKQFLTDMHSEIKAMTVNLNDIESDELPNLVSVEETIVIGKPEEMIEIQPDQVKYHTGQTPHPNRVDPKFKVMSDAEDEDFELIEINPEEVRIHDSAPQKQLLVPTKPRHESKSPSPHLAIISDFITAKMIQDEKKNTTVKESIETSEKKVCSETAVVTCVQVEQAAASSLIEESTQRSNYSNSMENTSKISQVTQEQVSMEKSSFQETSSEIINQIETKTETSQNFEVKIENFETSQKIESQKIENFSQNLTNVNQIEIKTETTEQIENFETTQQFENFETSQKIENFSQELANVNQIENSDYVMDKSETKKMEELFDKLVAEEATKMTKPVKSRSFDAIEKWLMNSHENQLQKVEIKEETSKETSKETKLQNKRNRNRTIDFSSLPNNADYYQSTATCVTKTYEAPKLVAQISTESEPDTSASSGKNIFGARGKFEK